MVKYQEKELLNDTLDRMMGVVNNGKIISKLQKSFFFTDEPKFYQYTAYLDEKDLENNGSGIDEEEVLAKIKAIGEGIERYCLDSKHCKDFLYGKPGDVGSVPLEEFVNWIDPESEEYNREIQNLYNYKYRFVVVDNLLENSKEHIPAQLIYVPYTFSEPIIRAPISSGASSHTIKEKALMNGIYELIERDAFMINYLLKIPGKRIKLKDIVNQNILKLIYYFKRYYLDVVLFDITLDLAPSVLCILIDKSNLGPSISVGIKSNLDIDEAIRGAILEAQHTRLWIKYAMLTKHREVKRIEDIHTIEDRGLYWSSLERLKDIGFLLNSKDYANIGNYKKPISLKEEMDTLKDMFSLKDYKVYVKDISTKYLKKKEFFIYKTIIPELHPLYLFENIRYIYSKRLNRYKRKYNVDEINNTPHPFL